MLPLAVILTTWKRVFRLPTTLLQLTAQTKQDFDLYVWNNNPQAADSIDEICRQTPRAITTIHSPTNMCGRGRQVLARHLRLKHGCQFVILLDDDIELVDGAIERLWAERCYGGVVGSYVWRASGPAIWPSIDCTAGEAGFFAAASGAIIDTSLFAHDQYWSLWPAKFWSLDSFWMSTMARALNYSITKSSMRLNQHSCCNDEFAQHSEMTTIILRKEFASLFHAPQSGRLSVPLYEGVLP